MAAQLLGLVLAGGRSRRMGQDKALLKPWGQEGETLLARAFGLLRKVAPVCMVSCAPGHGYAGYPCLPDAIKFAGPASGILAGLEYAEKNGLSGILALACDLAAMRSRFLSGVAQAMLAAPAGIWASCWRPACGGKAEMLVAAYAVAFLPHLSRGLASGERSLFRLLPEDRTLYLEYTASEAPCFRNCNTRADLELALGAAGRKTGPGYKVKAAPKP